MELADLARWTPIALDLSGERPTVDWCDLSGIAFTDPFFHQTVERARTDGKPRPVVRTDLDALLALDEHPSLEPCGLIFHASRCGSTLATRLLQSMPATLVVVEPTPLNALLEAAPDRVDEATRIRVIRLLVRAFGRVRSGEERHFVLKLSSWNVRRAGLITAAFPEVPRIWLQRAPDEVLASLVARPPAWLRSPPALSSIFGIDTASRPSDEAILTEALGLILESAIELAPDRVFDYRDLPDAVWRQMAALFGIALTGPDVTCMRERARFSAKSALPVLFDAGGAAPCAVSPSEQVMDRLMPLYQSLDAKRLSNTVAACSSR